MSAITERVGDYLKFNDELPIFYLFFTLFKVGHFL